MTLTVYTTPCKSTRVNNAHPLPRKERSEIELELAQSEYEAAKARVKLARAKLLALEEREGSRDEIYEEVQHVEEWVVQTSEEKDEPQHQQSRQDEITTTQALIREIKKLNAKDKDSIELPYFSGASAEWINFKKAYFESADNFSNAMNRARLRKALKGTAKEAVESLMNSVDDPIIVMQHLEDRFGRPGSLALAELDKMKRIKPVKNDPSDICRFASQVKACISVIKALKKPQYLHSPETSNYIREKMTVNMHDRFVAFNGRYRDTEMADLEVIDLFLTEETRNYGVFAPPEIYDTSKSQFPRKAVHTMQEPEERRKKQELSSTSRAQEIATRIARNTCVLCEGNHGLLECRKFREASVDERWEIAKKARLCFKCLRFRHQRMDCRAPPCRRCGRYHHVALHSERLATATQEKKVSCNNIDNDDDRYHNEDEYYYDKEPGEKTASIHAAVTEGKVYLKMVPVNLYGPKGQIRVLALLDEGSTITLLDSSIAEKIGAKGNRETLTIETIGGKELKKNNSLKVKLMIRGAHSREIVAMEARTIDDLKLSEQEVDANVVKNCPHLMEIRKELVYASEKPKLLIGQDNWGLIVTRKLLKGNASKPVASLTKLGWVLHGCDTEANAAVNFIGHCRTKEDQVEEIVKEHFKLGSLGIQPNLPSIDSNGGALEVLVKTTKKLPNGKCETTNTGESRLVFKKENPADDATRGTPNNFNKAARWFQGPSFSRRKEKERPVRRFVRITEDSGENDKSQQVATVTVSKIETPDLERFSTWIKLLRTTARVIQFVELLRNKKNKTVNAAKRKEQVWKPNPTPQKRKERTTIKQKKREKMHWIPLEEEHLRRAEEFLIKRSQMESFNKEITCLLKCAHLEYSSRLKKIDVYLSSNGIIKLRSRTKRFSCKNTNLPVLDGRQKIVRLLVEDYHKRFLHANTLTVMNETRQKYWILGLRTTVKGIIHGCQWCKVKKSMPQIPPMGDLLIKRLQNHRYPFSSGRYCAYSRLDASTKYLATWKSDKSIPWTRRKDKDPRRSNQRSLKTS